MACVGIDLGNANAVIAQAKRGGVDVLLNESSQRLNAMMVSFNDRERFIGDAAKTQAIRNYKNTASQVKRLLGRKFSEPDVQAEMDLHLPYTIVQLDDDEIGIQVMYNGTPTVFTPVQILAMIFTKLKEIIGAATGKSADVVLAVPSYFTDSARRAVLDACGIAGLSCLRLLNESTAAALSYGLAKSAKGEFDKTEETRVMFVDMGHSSFTASIVAFVQGKLRVIATASERNVGGRDVDAAVAQYFASEFKNKTGLDAWSNRKARLKLLAAAEKAKKDLSPHGVTNSRANVECLMEDTDFSCNLTVEQFDECCAPIIAKLEAPIRAAMEAASVTVKDLSSVEIVGGGMRPRVIKRTVASAIGVPGCDDSASGFGLKSTMNMDEAVSRGCAFMCAMLSPLFRVIEIEVLDSVPYDVRVSWDLKTGSDNDGAGDANSLVLMKYGSSTPCAKRVTFKSVDPFTITAGYDVDAVSHGLPASANTNIGTFRIEGFPDDVVEAARADPAMLPRVRVEFSHDANGIFNLEKAELLKKVAETPATPEAAPAADADAKPEDAAAAAADDKEAAESAAAPESAADGKEDAKEEGKEEASAGAADSNAGAGEAAATPPAASAATEATGEQPAKKPRYNRVSLSVSTRYSSGLSNEKLQEAIRVEGNMIRQDQEIRETQDKRNELETYIYDIRNGLLDRLAPYATEEDKANLQKQLTEMEDWLYGDGFDATKSVYQAKVDELRLLGDPIVRREYEHMNRAAAVKSLGEAVEHYRVTLRSETLEHLSDEDRKKVTDACTEAEAWLSDRLNQQGARPMTADVSVTIADIAQAQQKLRNICQPIVTKPKPKPPAPAPAPAPATTPAPTEGDVPASAADDSAAAGDAEGDASAASAAGEAEASAAAAAADAEPAVEGDADPDVADAAADATATPSTDPGMDLTE